MATPATYSRTQIYLHWLIAALVTYQIVLHEGIEHIWKGRMDGTLPNEPALNPHAIVGILIFVLMLWRLALRLTHGAPALPESEHPALKLIATITHVLFYALLLFMPISGSVAWFLGVEQPAVAHALAEKALIPLIALHILAALAQHYWFKTDVLKRMLGRT